MSEPIITFSHNILNALLLNSLYAAVLAIGAFIILRLARVRHAAILEAVWGLVLLRLILPPSLNSPISLRALLDLSLPADSLSSPPTQVMTPILASPYPAVPVAPISAAPNLWPLVLFALWALIMLGIVLGSWSHILRFRRIARAARPVEDAMINGLAAEWITRLNLGRPVRVVTSDRCLSPFTTGIRQPLVYLPETLLTWPKEALEPIIAHEIAHVGRADEARIILVNTIAACHFFNPLAWLAVRRLTQARERACDEAVIARCEISPTRLCESLVEVLRLRLQGPTSPAVLVGLVDGKKGVRMRLEAILSGRRASQTKPWLVPTLALLTGFVILPMAHGQRASENPPKISPTVVPVATQTPTTGLQVLRLGSDIVSPVKNSGGALEYPEEARKARIQGVVILEIVVDEQGFVKDTRVLRGLPLGLTEAAIQAVKTWRYTPARKNGVPVPVFLTVALQCKNQVGEAEGASTSDRTILPRRISGADPVYPKDLLTTGAPIRCTVMLDVLVDENGAPKKIKVLRPAPVQALDLASIEAVKTWRFEPATLDGKAVAAHLSVSIPFNLDPENGELGYSPSLGHSNTENKPSTQQEDATKRERLHAEALALEAQLQAEKSRLEAQHTPGSPDQKTQENPSLAKREHELQSMLEQTKMLDSTNEMQKQDVEKRLHMLLALKQQAELSDLAPSGVTIIGVSTSQIQGSQITVNATSPALVDEFMRRLQTSSLLQQPKIVSTTKRGENLYESVIAFTPCEPKKS